MLENATLLNVKFDVLIILLENDGLYVRQFIVKHIKIQCVYKQYLKFLPEQLLH